MNGKYNIQDFSKYEHDNAFMEHNHIKICSVSLDACKVKVELTKDAMNIRGFVHGGLLFSMADCAAGLVARADDRDYVTQSSHVNFLSNVTDGTLYATASVLRRGRNVVIVHVELTNETGKLLADFAMDMMCVS